MGRHLARRFLLGGHRGCASSSIPPFAEERGVRNSAGLMRLLGTTRSIAQGAGEKQKSAWAMRRNESFTCRSQGGPP